jgi:hypothetical protein
MPALENCRHLLLAAAISLMLILLSVSCPVKPSTSGVASAAPATQMDEQASPQSEELPPGPEVLGDEKFSAMVNDALDLLREKAPEAYIIVAENVGRIKQSPQSGMAAEEDPPTFELADTSAYYSLTWCAAVIAHDSYHSKLYHDYKNQHGLPVPHEHWAGVATESICNAHQIKVMEAIEAPQHELDYMATQDGTHSDVNGDG